MMRKTVFLALVAVLGFASCTKEGAWGDGYKSDMGEFSTSDGMMGPGGYGQGRPGGQAGVLTAGEWNDLANWDFWSGLMTGQEYGNVSELWGFFTSRRIAVRVADAAGNRLPAVTVSLEQGQKTIWTARTDNLGEADCWVEPYLRQAGTEGLAIVIDGVRQAETPKVTGWDIQTPEADVNFYVIDNAPAAEKRADLAFIVDATGSMGDEIAFLKKDLINILDRVKGGQSDIELRTGTVFYRDQGDEYVTKFSDFTRDYRETVRYISMQYARGGGDIPEAVHTALEAGLKDLSWNLNARARVAFLILDAPAHRDHQGVIESLQASIKRYAESGIKIIPVFCSSPSKECEFMCRYFAILTGGTYVFLTDDSGVGGDHIEASVGQFQVESLNDLLVRLISKYIG
jgi:hypothetical protein